MNEVGIDAIHFSVPKLTLAIEELAKHRNIEYAKLNKGLGLTEMAVCDIDEDAATLAAEAVYQLITTFNVSPEEVGRLYMGTESAVDSAKPTATYTLEMLQEKLGKETDLSHMDVVDMTFACIGGIDAFQNAMDWVRAQPSRKAIVVAADNAKYELGSSGEYTQGAGAVAVLITSNPRLVAFDGEFGVSTQSAGDFFKPRRVWEKSALLKQAAEILGVSLSEEQLHEKLENSNEGFWSTQNKFIQQYTECPVFDGPYSNECYQNRIIEALDRFSDSTSKQPSNWDKLIFHLPYAFQGRRMFTPIFIDWYKQMGKLGEVAEAIGEEIPETDEIPMDIVKKVSKTTLYKDFVHDRIRQGEVASSVIGNMYTASIFMALLSLLKTAEEEQEELNGKKIGFFAYGSGSKAKAFEGTVQPQWKEQLTGIDLFNALKARTSIDFETYEQIHREERSTPVAQAQHFKFESIENNDQMPGYRLYKTL
ncbi:MAG: hydroxymethylglutaryl-CoA synthase [Crocinitomicaceae bacterium]|nr:hydroxymethylglutaryl-CoA synthase [Crocinitomicaceae bacterium]